MARGLDLMWNELKHETSVERAQILAGWIKKSEEFELVRLFADRLRD